MTTLRHAHVIYDYGGRSLTLMYPPDAIGIWEVYDGMHYLGLLVESYVERRERYTPRRPGNQGPGHRLVTTDDWRSAVMYLVEAA
jgi:hypothetical protein